MKRRISNTAEVSVAFEQIKPGLKPAWLSAVKVKGIFKLLLKKEKRQKAVSIVFTNNRTIKRLNKLYRYRNSATDVLSFEYGKESELLGEIIISLETAKKQAKKYGNSFTGEIILLMVHGFYHILGYKHYSKADYHEMKKKEQNALKILAKKGIAG